MKLTSHSSILGADGSSIVFENEIRGRLIYTKEGYVSVVIVREGLKECDGINPCYSGRYRVVGDVVEHEIHVSTVPRYVDATERRKFRLSGELLVLLYQADHSVGLGIS